MGPQRWLLYGDLLERHVVESFERALTRAGRVVVRLDSLARDHIFREDAARDEQVLANIDAAGAADVCFNFRTAELSPHVLQTLRARGVTTVGWFSDDPLLYAVTTRAVAGAYDLTLHTGREDVLAWYEERHGTLGYSFPFWTDDEAFPPAGATEPSVELGFLGNLRGVRRAFRYDLLASLPFRTVFHGTLEHPLGDHARIHGGILAPDEIPGAIARFSVGLNLAQRFDDGIRDRFAFDGLERFGEYWFPSRLVQYAAVGIPSVTLTSGPAPLPSTLAVADRATLIEVVRALLDDPGFREEHARVAREVYERTLTADARVAMLLDVLDAPRPDRATRAHAWRRDAEITPGPMPPSRRPLGSPSNTTTIEGDTIIVVGPGPADELLPGLLDSVPDDREVVWVDATDAPGLFPDDTRGRLPFGPVPPRTVAWRRMLERIAPDRVWFLDGLVPPNAEDRGRSIAWWTSASATRAHLEIQRERCAEVVAIAGVAARRVAHLGMPARAIEAAIGPTAASTTIGPVGDRLRDIAARDRLRQVTGDAEHTICFDDHPRLEMEALRAIATGRAVVAPSTLALTLTPERSVVPAHDRSARIAAAGYLASAAAEAHAIAHAARAEVDQHHGWAARWGTRDTPAVTPRVAVIGYYGARNAGDELILESLVTHLRARVRVVAYRPEHVPASHGLPSTRLGSPEATGTIVQSDALLIGGGGLLQDYLFRDAAGWARARHAPRGLPAFLRHAIEARTAGKHVALWSIGVGPVEGRYGKVLTRLLAETATLVTVREAASVVTLRDCDYSGPVEVVNDPTTLLPLADAVPVDRIAVALRSFPGTPDAFIPQLADGLDRIIERTALPVAFVGFQRDPADDEIHAAVRARMRHADRATILGLDDPRDIHRAVATSRLVIGMRLHASILANAAGIPSVGLAYDPKVRAHYDETGQGDACLALDASPDLLADAVERALRADPRARADAHRAAAAAATRGFDRLHALLAGPAPAAFDPDPIARALDALET